jgi:hypothetical protein
VKEMAKAAGSDDWFTGVYIPRAVLDKTLKKWMDGGAKAPKESLFDLVDYKEIIKMHSELNQLFLMKEKGHTNLNWMDKMNELMRDPAHPEKSPPSKEQMLYFEKMTDEVVKKIQEFKAAHP